MKGLAFAAAVLVGFAAPSSARAALFFVFDQPAGAPNARVTVRTGATPTSFRLSQRVKPFQKPVRLYLVRDDAATATHTRFDSRLHFVGVVVPDRRGRGLLTFSVPPLDAGAYTIAYWCPGCARTSRGRTFFVQQPADFAPRYRARALLRISATQACPVTLPNANRPPRQPRHVTWYGNGLLWAGLEADGTDTVSPDRIAADGSIANKLLWVTTPPSREPAVSGERLDAAAPPLRVLGMNHGSFSGAVDPSFMSPVVFPTAGCWRLRARLGDLSLTYVVRVVVP